MEFIHCKAAEERKAWALIDAGYDGSFNGEAYNSIFFQNANHSVRVTDEFMEAVVHDRQFHTRAVTTGAVTDTYRAREIWHEIALAAHQCGDPGLQFDTTVNSWHTCPNTARINASNPCSEYMFLDDSACNLASLNLRKFQFPEGHPRSGDFDVEAFQHAVDITTLAQEIIVDNAKYPTERIGDNSHKFRPLGLGYANLGALLMSRGLPYDSDAGRAYAGAVTALMGGRAYRMSAVIAFYSWLKEEGTLDPENAPWRESDRYVQFKDHLGFKVSKTVTTTTAFGSLPFAAFSRSTSARRAGSMFQLVRSLSTKTGFAPR